MANLGISPQGLAITPNGEFVYVANFDTNNVSVISTATNTVVGVPIPVGSNPVAFGYFIGPNIIVAQGGPLSIANDAALTPLGFGTFLDFNGGTLQTTGSLITSRTISLLALGGIVDSNGFDSLFSGNIINAGSLSKIGAGTLTLSGNNSYSGGTNILGGAISVSSDTNLGTGNISIGNHGELLTTGATFTTGKTIALGTGGGTLASANGTTATYGGVISGSGPLTIGDGINQGTIILSATNVYNGGTTINRGTVEISADVNLGTASGGLTFNGGTLQTLASFSTARATTLNAAGGIFEPNAGTTLTAAGTISGVGELTEIGPGTVILGGNNSYTGGTTVVAGTLRAGSPGGFANNTAYTVNGGTLDLNGFNLTMSSLNGTGGTVNLGSAALTVNDIGKDAYSGIIRGNGSLTKLGAGVLTLLGNNSYTGGTTVVTGTLRAGSPGGFVSNTAYTVFGGMLDLNNFNLKMSSLNGAGGKVNLGSAALTVNNTGTDVYSGLIQGTGSLSKLGPGTLTLSGNNSYTGGTTVVAGTLRAGSPGGFPNNTAYTVNGGTLDLNSFNLTMSSINGAGGIVSLGSATLTVNNTGTDVYSGLIQGTGSLSKLGPGTLTLSGNNSYSGGTTINAGILEIGADVNLGSASGGLTFNGGTLQTLASFSTARATTLNAAGGIFEPNAGTTLTAAGTISGIGGLTKTGAGVLVLEGDNAYSGGTVLNAGTLVVSSAQALGLGNVVVNGGMLSADPQPINVKGNYSQNAGGTLQLMLGGSAPGQYDFLNVGGHAALDGTLQLLSLNGFQPKIGDKLTLVLAAGGVSGQFASVLNPFSSLDGLELIYEPTSVVLEFVSDFAAFARTPNELAVAAQLDRLAFDPRETQLITFLQNEPLTNLGRDFEKISPDSLSALYEISFSAANVQEANLENRFAEIRNGSTGFSSSLNVSNSPGAVVENKDGKTVIEPKNDLLAPSPENKWGVWTSGSGQFVNVNSDGNGKGYDFTTGGVSLGLDYRLTKSFTVGIAVGYAHTWTNLTSNGNIDVNSGKGEIYAAFFQGGFYLNGYAGGGYNSYDARRDGLGGDAAGSTSGGEFDGYFGGGYEFRCGEFTFGPIASLQGTYVDVSGYNESGSLAPLRIVSQSQASLRTNVGLGASYTWKFGQVQLKPSLRASWQHEYLYGALPIDAQFASGAGDVFTVHGPAEGHDSALIDAGVNVQWTPNDWYLFRIQRGCWPQ